MCPETPLSCSYTTNGILTVLSNGVIIKDMRAAIRQSFSTISPQPMWKHLSYPSDTGAYLQ